MLRRWSKGVSVVECLVVLAVLALLVAMATPSFSSTRREAALTASVNQLLAALHFTRSAAILHNAPAVLCLSTANDQCVERAGDASSLIQGWQVIQRSDASPASFSTEDAPHLRAGRFPEEVSVHASRVAITFWPTARAGTTGTITLCSRQKPLSARKIVVSQTGRPRVAASAPSECEP